MSVWSKLIDKWNTGGADAGRDGMPPNADAARYAMIDIEMGATDHKIRDIGAIRYDGAVFHKASKAELSLFLQGARYLCGHNIVHHDAHYLFGDDAAAYILVDTLYMSPILFPERPYHHLVKDDKLLTDQLNNPVNDCEKARALLMDEMQRWSGLPLNRRRVLATLLAGKAEFSGFMSMVEAHDLCLLLSRRPAALWTRRASSFDIDVPATAQLIRTEYKGMICQNADVEALISSQPCALAYALSLVSTTDYHSVTPGWVLHHYPEVEHIIRLLRQTRCEEGCDYCNRWLNLHRGLKLFFGYDSFRTYDGEPLQENAARAAVRGQSLLAVFPTGGGKSLTFQLPAMMSGRLVHGLTVVISPLQSLMKDQVDNLASRGIADAVTINGLLDPIARAQAIESVQNGDASMLYIAPEMLRSKTIERLLMGRHVVRFVIDEAHCFSAWGQDFRVDYLYIGKFISEYQRRKGGGCTIPVSCFTATAKQKVVQDICDYFRKMAWRRPSDICLRGLAHQSALFCHTRRYRRGEIHPAARLGDQRLKTSAIRSMSDLCNPASSEIDNTLRCYYVGITRARRRLFIHTNSSLFNRMKADTHTSDSSLYPEPGQIVLHLTHRDVKLGFFKDRKNDVLALRSGDALTYEEDKHVIYDKKSGRSVAKPSARMEATLEQWHKRGYHVTGASVRFVVAWKPKGAPVNEPETAVLLPSLTLVRSDGKG